MIPIHVITGFLGSGKTTLLKRILDEYADRKRVAIIQNEFAPTGVDGKELQGNNQNFTLVEINNGSVFCVCRLHHFLDTLKNVIEKHKPDVIFLEASGLADPINIMEIFQSETISGKIQPANIITVVDALNFAKLWNKMSRYRHQIMIADKVIVNKLDLSDNDQAALLDDRIAEINPFAEIIHSSYCKVPLCRIMHNVKFHHAANCFIHQPSEGKPEMSVLVMRAHGEITKENVTRFVTIMQAKCIRIKGLVNLTSGKTALVQSVFDTFEIKEINNYQGANEFIFFGHDLTLKEIKMYFTNFVTLPDKLPT